MSIQYIKQCLVKWFDFPNNKLYCQLSTFNNMSPHVRTMELYHINKKENFVFLTETHSKKWKDLSDCPTAAICLLNLNHGQIIIKGKTELKTSLVDFDTTQFYWHHYLNQYWRDYYLSRTSSSRQFSNEIPSSFGVIILQPHFFEILTMNQKNYLQSQRTQYLKKEKEWIMRESEVS